MSESDKLLVKLYQLNDEKAWVDRGTGYLFFYMFENSDETPCSYRFLIAEDIEAERVMHEFELDRNTNYEIQQDTLVSWADGETEYTISFQSASSCQITYDTIQASLRALNGEDSPEDVTRLSSEAVGTHLEESILIPELNIENLQKLSNLFADSASLFKREQLSALVDDLDFFKTLVPIFHECEENKDLNSLTHIFIIMKGVLSLTKFAVYESIISDNNLMDILGILEYNPALSTRIEHRKIVESSRLVEVVPFSNQGLKKLIISTYRLQYLQEILVPTPMILEERSSYLLSILYFRKSEIVEAVSEDENFIPQLFKVLNSTSTEHTLKETVLKLFSELCSMSKILQIDQKKTYLSKLISHNIISSLGSLISDKFISAQKYIIDILFRLCEIFSDKIREKLFLNPTDISTNDFTFFKFICDCVHESPASNESQMAVQIMQLLLDMNINSESCVEFYNTLYQGPLDYLFDPLSNYTFIFPLEEKSFAKALLIENLLEILNLILSCPTSHIENFLIRDKFLVNLTKLLNSKYSFIVHGCVKIMRHCLSLTEKNFKSYLCKEKILDNFLDSLLNNHSQYTLINSSIIDLFEFLKISNNKQVAADIVERRKSDMEKITYVYTFKKLIIFGEQFMKIKASKLKSSFLIRANELFRNFSRSLNEDDRENFWFSSEENDEQKSNQENSNHIISDNNNYADLPQIKSKSDSNDDKINIRPMILQKKIKFSLKNTASGNSVEKRTLRMTNGIENSPKSLVDYSDDDETDDKWGNNVNNDVEANNISEIPSPKKSKIV